MASVSTSSVHKPLLELEQVSVVRDSRTLLENISLKIHHGELVSILGPNGGGKTTLIKLITGSITPTTGKVLRKPRLRISYQPQRSMIAEHIPLTVRDLLQIGNQASVADCQEQLDAFVLPADILKRQVTSLSGGERQNVMIVRAFLQRADLLILDEPGTYCEHRKLSDMYARIEKFARDAGCATVMVSHDLSRVLEHSDHIYCLDRKIVCDGGPDRIIADAEFEELYGERGHAGIYRHNHN